MKEFIIALISVFVCGGLCSAIFPNSGARKQLEFLSKIIIFTLVISLFIRFLPFIELPQLEIEATNEEDYYRLLDEKIEEYAETYFYEQAAAAVKDYTARDADEITVSAKAENGILLSVEIEIKTGYSAPETLQKHLTALFDNKDITIKVLTDR